MAETTSIDNAISMLTKLNSSIENNITVQNRYTNQIKKSMKIMDKTKNINKVVEKISRISKVKDSVTPVAEKAMSKPNKTKGNVTSKIGSSISKTKERFSKTGDSFKKIGSKMKKMVDSAKSIFEAVKSNPIVSGIMKGIGKNEEFSAKIAELKEKFANILPNLGEKIAPMLMPALEKISAILDGPAFQKMMQSVLRVVGVLIQSATMLLDYLVPIIDIISRIFDTLFENSDKVIMVLGMVAAAILAMAVATQIFNAINTVRIIKEKILNAVQNANPTMFIIKAIILLIMAFITLIATMEPVRTAIADLTRKFFDFIEWGINGLIEGLASAAEGIIRFAGDGINTFLNIFVNPFVDGINLIIDGLNLLGANVNKLDHFSVDFSGAAEATGEFIRKGKVDLSGAKEAVAGAIENFSAEELMAKLGISGLEAGVDSHKKDVGVQVNKVNDDVNIADEDIKLMREVAEREMIQNFVTLTPTVSMGDMTVNENADADKLLGKITEALVTEVANSAQGVYA